MADQNNDLDFNILDEQVNEKSYTQPNVSLSQKDLSSPIGEPSFTPPPASSDDDFKVKETAEQIREKKNPEPFNPEMKYLPKKEQNMAAEQMADLILVGYGRLHDFANYGLQIDAKKLNKMHKDGKINLNAMVEYDIGSEMPARDFFQEYNKEMQGFFKLDDEFVEDVKPVLVRVLAKKGIGMTDENYLLFKLAEDAGTKAFMFIQQKRQIGEMLKVIGEATTSKNANPAPPPPPMPEATPEPQQQATKSSSNDIGPTYVEAVEVENSAYSEVVSPDAIILPSKKSGKRGRKPKNQ